uniref:Ankyrin repeat and SOCS box containing 3 n=1 Tax=Sphaeramia orbicularis TaxID=375764 RepID=A0A673CEJ6_9TELE
MNFTEVYGDTVSSVALAARSGCRKQVRRLIQRGGSVDCRDNRGWNSLHEAAAEGHESCVDFLLGCGANPNTPCSSEWPQLPIHAAAQFGRISVLRRLIAATDRGCDRGRGQVSPLYLAIHNNQRTSVELLLKEGFSPDAQDCWELLGLRSPLLVSAGASLIQDHWDQVLAADRTDLLRLILDLRRIPHLDLAPCHRPEAWGPAVLTLPELKHLLSAAVTQVDAAARWLPLLLNAGLDPHLLLLDGLDGAVLNYLLQFVNWSTLSLDLKLVLDRRQAEKTWSPLPQFDSLPSLFHLCRMRIRTLLGPDLLMRTAVVQQLPLPSPLHAVLLTAHLI